MRGALKVLLVVAPLVALALFAYRPTPVVGVDGSSLAFSVGSGWSSDQCAAVEDRWNCEIDLDPGSGAIVYYKVTVDGVGCWEATPARASRGKRTTGCISLLDHFRLL